MNPATLLKVILLHRRFSRFLNCTNSPKPRRRLVKPLDMFGLNKYYIFQITIPKNLVCIGYQPPKPPPRPPPPPLSPPPPPPPSISPSPHLNVQTVWATHFLAIFPYKLVFREPLPENWIFRWTLTIYILNPVPFF